MSMRTVTILAAAAALALLLAVLAERGGGPTAARSALLLPELATQAEALDRIEIIKAGNEPVATIERREDGWAVAERQGYPADIAKLRQALVALSEARIVETKTANPELYDRLAVEDVSGAEAGGVAISFAGGGWSPPPLIVGDAEGGSHRYVRRASEAQSYLIDRNPDLPRNTSQWLAPEILDVPGTRVQQVTITHPDGEQLRIFKDDASAANFSVADIPEGRELQYAGVANVSGNTLRELALEDVEQAAPTDLPTTTVELRTFDGLVVEAEGFERDGGGWLSFTASFDPAQAERFAPAEDGGAGDGGEQAAAADDAPAPDAEPAADDAAAPGAEAEAARATVAAEAAAIDARVSGWRYRIASYQYDQLTRRMEDLLQAETGEEPAE